MSLPIHKSNRLCVYSYLLQQGRPRKTENVGATEYTKTLFLLFIFRTQKSTHSYRAKERDLTHLKQRVSAAAYNDDNNRYLWLFDTNTKYIHNITLDYIFWSFNFFSSSSFVFFFFFLRWPAVLNMFCPRTQMR